MQTDRLIFTVSQLNAETSRYLKQGFSDLCLEGEVSNLSRPSSGHIYFTLKDHSAQLRCAMFRSRYRVPSKIKLENGQKILAHGNVGLYEPRGDYQFIVDSIEDIGTGQLQQQFETLKQKLQAAGLFEEAHKKTIPTFIKRLAIITSPTGAAIQDMLNVLERRSPHIAVTIYPVAVQGNEAAPQMVKALQQAQNNQPDTIVLARGGGSIEDLWVFNEEVVAQAIYDCDIPIVTGVGHEIDFTIADFVADQRAPTPSAAAELVSLDSQQLQNTFQHFENRLSQVLQQQLQQSQKHIDQLQYRLTTQHPQTQLEQKNQRLDELELRLKQAIQQKLKQTQQQSNNLQTRLQQQQPLALIEQYKNRLERYQNQLTQAMQHKLDNSKQQLSNQAAQLNAFNPLNTLERGYSLAYKNNVLVTQTKQVKVGQNIEVKLSDGDLHCKVQAVQSRSNELL